MPAMFVMSYKEPRRCQTVGSGNNCNHSSVFRERSETLKASTLGRGAYQISGAASLFDGKQISYADRIAHELSDGQLTPEPLSSQSPQSARTMLSHRWAYALRHGVTSRHSNIVQT
ncbi:hypothetical protein Scep_000186 [Stephania cephalantha]|uniref:Uncharacterized protein n=1 Tax=Stephania cephalantha TaxID=152367 RepID=A0AAP0Q2P9_9MAGN